ncbi:hypothetical protein QBC36DRAFT_341436, partial [Triangularia setosa]
MGRIWSWGLDDMISIWNSGLLVFVAFCFPGVDCGSLWWSNTATTGNVFVCFCSVYELVCLLLNHKCL